MDSIPSQDRRVVDDPWHKSRSQGQQQDNSPLSFESDTPILDETIAIVNEKVWSFRAALKAAAEVLVNYGLSPQVVGYSSVPLGEDDQLAEKNEGEAALQKVVNDEMLSRSASSANSETNAHKGQNGEVSRLVHQEDYEDDSNHAFVEAGRKDKDEQKSLTPRAYDVDQDEEYDNR